MEMSCRLCEEAVTDIIMVLEKMPKAAQYFLYESELDDDVPINMNICQCKYCGLVQLDGSPVEYYKDVITAASFSETTKSFRLSEISEMVSKHQLKGKRAIEIGCGEGAMLDILNEAGLSATGLEHGASSVMIGQSLGRNVIEGFLEEGFTLDEEPFDFFLIYNFLEHLPDPNRMIKAVNTITTDDAVGYVTVPNLDHLYDTQCSYEFVADHLSYFTEYTIKFAFYKNGFNILECYRINNNNDIVVKVKKRKVASISEMFQEVEILILKLQGLVASYHQQNKKVAIWGAGHRTLALLALAGVDKIAYVVDSAKFKQGKYTPILHKPVVSPEQLIKAPVDLVIVMVPGIYPDEVIKIIESMGIESEVAVLKGNEISFVRSLLL